MAKDTAEQTQRGFIQVGEQTVNGFIDVGHNSLSSHLQSLKETARAIAEATGEHRANQKSVLKEGGYDKFALDTIKKLDAMSISKRCDALRSLFPMLDAKMEMGWKLELRDLLAELEQEGGEGDAAS